MFFAKISPHENKTLITFIWEPHWYHENYPHMNSLFFMKYEANTLCDTINKKPLKTVRPDCKAISNSKHTVNVVIFAGGKFRENVVKDISRGGNFHDSTPICFIKAYGFYFRVGVIFAKKTKARKTRKLPPREKFHVYSKRQRLTKMLTPEKQTK